MGNLSSRLRFEILKRDNFRCVYCGASGADVELHIDHKTPRVVGGGNGHENLVTACSNCNHGKGGIPLHKKAFPKNPPASRPGLVGKCFMVFGDDGKINWQGIIRASVTDQQYLIQYFDWVIGEPSTMAIVNLSTMVSPEPKMDRKPGSWVFFEDDEHLRAWSQGFGKQHLHNAREEALDRGPFRASDGKHVDELEDEF